MRVSERDWEEEREEDSLDFELRHVKWVQLKLLGESDPVDKYFSL